MMFVQIMNPTLKHRLTLLLTIFFLTLFGGFLQAADSIPVDLSGVTIEGGADAPVTAEMTKVDFHGESIEALKLTMQSRKAYNAIQIPVDSVDGRKYNTLQFKIRPKVSKEESLGAFGVWIITSSTHYDAIRFQQRATVLDDGWYQFSWDFANQPSVRTIDDEPVVEVRFRYPFDGIPEGKTDTMLIADMQFVSGLSVKTGDAKLTQKWKEYIGAYSPDYSDSSKYLSPPESGRLTQPLLLAKDGKARSVIIVPEDASASLRLAGNELRHWLNKITGADIKVASARGGEGMTEIILGRAAAAGKFDGDIQALENSDGFAVRAREGNLYIFGATDKGTLNGVFAFLENNTDIIWPRPLAELSAIYTPTATLEAVWGNALERPATRLRGWGTNMGIRQEANLWMMRNRNNFVSAEGVTTKNEADVLKGQGNYVQFGGGHNISNYLGKNPDFYPVIGGEKVKVFDIWKHQPNFTAPGIADAVAENMLSFIRDKAPEDVNCITINIEDNWGVSTDPKSLEPITLPDGSVIGPDDPAFRSTQFFLFLNDVAKKVNAVHPDLMLETYGYFFTATPPKVDVDPHIRIMICPYPRTAYHLPLAAPINAGWWDQIAAWAKASPNVILREYYGVMNGFRPQAEVVDFDVKSLLSLGVGEYTAELSPDAKMIWADGEMRGTPEEFDLMAMDYWVINRIYWDPNQDVEQLRKYYIRRVFHEAAPEMEKFFGIIRSAWFKEDSHANFVDPVNLMKNMIIGGGREEELRQLLAEAATAAKNPGSRMMIDMIRQTFDKWAAAAGNPAPAPAGAPFKFTPEEQLRYGWVENTDWDFNVPAWAAATFVNRDGKAVPAVRMTVNPERVGSSALTIWNPFAPGLLKISADDVLSFSIIPADAKDLAQPLKIALTAKDENNKEIQAPDSAFTGVPGGGVSVHWKIQAVGQKSFDVSKIKELRITVSPGIFANKSESVFHIVDMQIAH